ncbi:MAG: hypothetical protein FWE32_08310 [Oscillospiraceae bacterium]|nr:hypothetical protein [Oscillospiraceae bacterium]
MFDKRLLVTGVSLVLVVTASAMAAILPNRGEEAAIPVGEPITQERPARRTMPRQEDPEPEYLYTIREHEGRIAVFSPNATEPAMVLETLIRHLPAYDQMELREGIKVYTIQELEARLEDYTS